ncbi:MAG TPA: LysM peptidoglycan-binding domain-containing protein, partial [Candidatus Didemnitutus sp.]
TAKEIASLAEQLQRARETNKAVAEANRALLAAKAADDTPTREAYDQLAAERDQIKGQLAAAQKEADAHAKSVAELTAANQKLEQERDGLKDQVAALPGQVEAARREAANNAGRVASDKAATQERLEAVGAELVKAQQENDELRKSTVASTAALQSAHDTIDKLQADLTTAQARADDEHKVAESHGNSVAELTATNQKLEQERDGLKQQVAAFPAQLDTARKDAAVTADKISSDRAALQERLEAVGAQLVKTQQENDDLKKSATAAATEAQSSHDAREKLRTDLATAQSQLDEEHKAAEAHGSSVAELTAANEKLTQERDGLQQDATDAKAEAARLTQAMHDADQLRSEGDRAAQQNIDALTAQLAQVRRDLDSARTAQSRLAESTANQERDRAAVIGQMRNENAALSARLTQAQGTLDQIAATARLGTPAAQIASGGTPTIPTISTSGGPTTRIHVVTDGDSLSRISLRYYGTTTRWQEIYNANRELLQAANALKVGMQLRIP